MKALLSVEPSACDACDACEGCCNGSCWVDSQAPELAPEDIRKVRTAVVCWIAAAVAAAAAALAWSLR